MKREHDSYRCMSGTVGRMLSGMGLLTFLLLSAVPVAAQQPPEYDRYPQPFIYIPEGGYPSQLTGGSKLYMEGYFPPPVTASPIHPAWSPRGDSLAFAAHGRLWIVPVEGGMARQLTTGPGYHSEPSWSPDGRHLAYTADVDQNLDIYILDRTTGEARRITEDGQMNLRPRWSPDGSRILYTTMRDGRVFDLWAYGVASGVSEPIISDSNQNDMAGDWIGDTGDIVFVSKRGEAALGAGSLWRWNAARQEAELLLRLETDFNADPVVASHGGVLAYITDESARSRDLYVLPTRRSARGIQPIRLTFEYGGVLFPDWSPDAERLVYVRNGGTPDRPRTADHGMGFALYTISRGGGQPQPVPIHGYEWSEPTGTVQVRVVGTDGELVPSRIYLTGADGRGYFPDTSFPRVHTLRERYWFHTDGEFSVTMPVGTGEFEATRGFEYEPVSRTVNVRRGEVTTIEVELRRWIDMGAMGWWSGDNHIHVNYGGHEYIHPEDVRNKAHAEDLNVVNGMIANYWGNSRIEDVQYFLGRPHPNTGARTVVYYNQEYRPSFFTHLSLLKLIRLITPFFLGSEGTAWHSLYPDNSSVLREVHEQGGIGGYTHPYGLGHRDPTFEGDPLGSGGSSARQLPVDAILGLADFADIACYWTDEIGSSNMWYRMLNTGSRVTATAGSDAMTNMWRMDPVGGTRVYVNTGETNLDYDTWIDALAAGRAFVSTGPMLTLDVSGRGMGEELAVSRGDVVRVSTTARSIFRMDRLDIIQNGQVIHTVEATGDQKEIEAVMDVPIESSGWIAVRVLGPTQRGVTNSYLFGHTNPVYVIADDQPIRSSEDASYFVRWIDRLIGDLTAMDAWDDPAHKREVLSTFEEGRRLYQEQSGS